MCAMPELWCRELRVSEAELTREFPQVAFDFRRSGGESQVMVTYVCESCLCTPNGDQRRTLFEFLTFITENSTEVLYAPNDYSENEEPEEETWTVGHVLEEYPPSLSTPAVRFRLTPTIRKNPPEISRVIED